MTPLKKRKKIYVVLFYVLLIGYSMYNLTIMIVLPRWRVYRLTKRPTSTLVLSSTVFLHEPGLGQVVGFATDPPNSLHPTAIYVLGENAVVKCALDGTVLDRIQLATSDDALQFIPATAGAPRAFLQHGITSDGVTLLDANGRERWNKPGVMLMDGAAGRFTRPDSYSIGFGQGDGSVQLLDMQGKRLWKVKDEFTPPLLAADANGDGKDELIYGTINGKQLIIRDGDGHLVKRVKPVTRLNFTTLTRWPDASGQVCLLQADDRFLRLMNFDGKLVKEFLLPEGDFYRACYGTPVQLTAAAPYYAVVTNDLVDGPVTKSYLVVYDRQGAMVYRTPLRNADWDMIALLAIPARGNIARQAMLVGLDDGKVLRYTYLRSQAVR